MNKYHTGLAVQGGGVLLLAVGLVHLIKAQPLMSVILVGGIIALVVGYFMKRDI